MNNAFVKHTLAAGKKGEEWLQQLPEIIEKYEGKWSFQALNPFDLSYNYVAPAKQKNGTKTVLPIGIP